MAHGEDVLLIYWHTLRDFPYSAEEAKVGNNLINLYYNFAMHGLAIYDALKVDPVKPDDFQGLEILSPEDFKLVQFADSFGNIKFWDNIEKKLSEKLRKDEL